MAYKDWESKSEAFQGPTNEDELHRLSPAARPLYTHAYNTVGRGVGAFESMSTVYFLPYQVRLVFVLTTNTPFSGSVETGVVTVSVRPGPGVGGKKPKIEL